MNILPTQIIAKNSQRFLFGIARLVSRISLGTKGRNVCGEKEKIYG
jgi:hypothetical protein